MHCRSASPKLTSSGFREKHIVHMHLPSPGNIPDLKKPSSYMQYSKFVVVVVVSIEQKPRDFRVWTGLTLMVVESVRADTCVRLCKTVYFRVSEGHCVV